MSYLTCKRRRRRCGRAGAVALEFALVLPVMITIVLGCIDLGRFAYTYVVVTSAARVGAGIASLNPVGSDFTLEALKAEIFNAVADDMGSGFDTTKIVLPTPEISTDEDGQKRVKVEVGYPFEMIVDWPWLPGSFDLKRAVEMRVIR